jgi:hypothetical protein
MSYFNSSFTIHNLSFFTNSVKLAINNENHQTNLEISVRGSVYPCGCESFYKSAVLFENDAADSARTSFSRVHKRSFRDYFRRNAVDSAIPKNCGVVFDRTFDRGFSRKHLYGDESAVVSRILGKCFVYQAVDTVYFDCLGILVHEKSPIKRPRESSLRKNEVKK